MSLVLTSFYARYRVECGAVPVLREDNESPPERLLQAIWQHQRILRDDLQTVDGLPVRILHPGFLNVESGPDFRGAVVQIGEDASRAGDIEVDLKSSGWRNHGHDRNPAFKQVILHVVWDSECAAAGGPPAIRLKDVLDAPLGELSLWLGGESAADLPTALRGQCCAPLGKLAAEQVIDLLHQAAMVRLQSKAAQFQARSRQVGWDQCLWEGMFRALGYKHNVWPMQRLAELRPRWAQGTDPSALEARLFGISGLLPMELSGSTNGADQYIRRIWDHWWRERDQFADCLLPKNVWRLHGLRPANHPQRRLALGVGWILKPRLKESLESWCAEQLPRQTLLASLAELLQAEAGDFWARHWTFRSSRLSKAQPLLGETRVTDLAVNVVLPWLWSRATEGNNKKLKASLQDRYFSWPPAEDNSVLRLARSRLLGNRPAIKMPGAAAQQGLIQMVRDFCDHSNSICEGCKLPGLVREFGALNRTDQIAVS